MMKFSAIVVLAAPALAVIIKKSPTTAELPSLAGAEEKHAQNNDMPKLAQLLEDIPQKVMNMANKLKTEGGEEKIAQMHKLAQEGNEKKAAEQAVDTLTPFAIKMMKEIFPAEMIPAEKIPQDVEEELKKNPQMMEILGRALKDPQNPEVMNMMEGLFGQLGGELQHADPRVAKEVTETMNNLLGSLGVENPEDLEEELAKNPEEFLGKLMDLQIPEHMEVEEETSMDIPNNGPLIAELEQHFSEEEIEDLRSLAEKDVEFAKNMVENALTPEFLALEHQEIRDRVLALKDRFLPSVKAAKAIQEFHTPAPGVPVY